MLKKQIKKDKHFAILAGFLACYATAHPNSALAAGLPQAFTYQGRLTSPDGTLPLNDVVDFKFSIYATSATSQDCLLYEELQTNVDVGPTSGMFALEVGSALGSSKRSFPGSTDPSLSMSRVFANTGTVLRADDSGSTNTCPGGYTPASGDARRLRLTITPHGTGTPIAYADAPLAAVPLAHVAETLQGIAPTGFIQTQGNVSQATITSLTNGSEASSLHHHDSRYVQINGSGDVGIGTGSPSAKLDVSGGTVNVTAPSGTPALSIAGSAVIDSQGRWVGSSSGLVGSTGPMGASGSNGATGVTGASGANGFTGVSGADGLAGAPGSNGAIGQTGATGASGTNGSNGATGASGNNGAVGATGASGTNGSNGATGASGTNGSNGAVGQTGASGSNGSAGATGATGTNGSDGATGASGTNGAVGVTGQTGASPWLLNGNDAYYSAGNIGIGINTTPTSPLDVSTFITGGASQSTIAAFYSVISGGQSGDVVGIWGYPRLMASGTDTTRVESFRASIVYNTVGQTLTNAIGFHAESPALVGGAITNSYGLYVDSMLAGTNRWAVFTAGTTPSSFGGSVGIGTTGPAVSMHIASTIADAWLGGGGNFQIGATNAKNLVMDDDEIMARNNGAASDLLLQNNGGNTIMNVGGGNVGIGTAGPSRKFEVSDTGQDQGIKVSPGFAGGAALYFTSKANNSTAVVAISALAGGEGVSDCDAMGVPWRTVMNTGGSSLYELKSGGCAGAGADPGFVTRLAVDATGNVGIGITNPGTKLQVAGVITPSADNTYTLGDATHRFSDVYSVNAANNTSDAREKTEVQDSDLGLDFIKKLRPVSYHWKSGADTKLHYGLIAQETEKAVTESRGIASPSSTTPIITYDEGTDRYGLRYTELISPMIGALKELSSDNAAKDLRIQALERENAMIKAHLCAKDPAASFCK